MLGLESLGFKISKIKIKNETGNLGKRRATRFSKSEVCVGNSHVQSTHFPNFHGGPRVRIWTVIIIIIYSASGFPKETKDNFFFADEKLKTWI